MTLSGEAESGAAGFQHSLHPHASKIPHPQRRRLFISGEHCFSHFTLNQDAGR